MNNDLEFNDAKVFDGTPQASGDLLGEGKALVKTQTEFCTAITVQKPRSLDAVVEAVKREATYGGDDFYYRWPVKTKTGKTQIIEGGTIGLALAIAREWGNVAIPLEVEEKNGKWIFTASFVDLEKGFTITRTFRQKIPTSSQGKYDIDRWQDMSYQKGQSQAIRNVIFNGVPRWLRSEAIEIAKESSLKKITKGGIDTAKTKAIEYLMQYGIDEERIKAVLGKELNELLPDDIQTLRNMAAQIKNGDVSPERAFPPVEEPKTSTIDVTKKGPKPPKPKAKKEVENVPLPTSATPDEPTVECPDNGDMMRVSYCTNMCEKYNECEKHSKDELTPEKAHELAHGLIDEIDKLKDLNEMSKFEDASKNLLEEIQGVDEEAGILVAEKFQAKLEEIKDNIL